MKLVDRVLLKPVASEVAKLNRWLDDAFEKASCDTSVTEDLKLCINEAIANLISYAFDDTSGAIIIVEIELEPSLARAVILDNGVHFDFRQWPPAEKPKNLETARPGGFGIALIRERAGRIDYDHVGDFNRLTIVCSTITP
jgi:anti-sigma regulatory factor (Ser/Thr protein kinase)